MYVAASSSTAPAWRAVSSSQPTNNAKAFRSSDNASGTETGSSRGTDSVSISSQAAGHATADSSKSGKSESAPSAATGKPLTDEQKQEIDKLKERDSDVRRHEAAHLAAAGGTARSGAEFDYQTGPDGQHYAIGGHVDIDLSPVAGNPSATIAKMQQVERAALAPADPSGQDRAVASQAAAAAQKARGEVAEQQKPSAASSTSGPSGVAGTTGSASSGSKAGGKSASGSSYPFATSTDGSGSLLDVTA
jgi:hypothetical protein